MSEPRRIILTHVGAGQASFARDRAGWAINHRSDDRDAVHTMAQTSLAQGGAAFDIEQRWPGTVGNNAEMSSLLGPELWSLYLLDLQPGDEIALIATDTLEGEAWAIIVQTLLLANLQGFATGYFSDKPAAKTDNTLIYVHPVQRIGGLQLLADKFVETGLQNYVAEVFSLYDRARAGKQLIFNVTAGYKSLVPFATLLAALLGSISSGDENGEPQVTCELTYVYERDTKVIKLPRLPVIFDQYSIAPYRRIFAAASSSQGAPIGSLGLMNPYHRAIYLRKLAKPRDHWGLSALGQLVWLLFQKTSERLPEE